MKSVLFVSVAIGATSVLATMDGATICSSAAAECTAGGQDPCVCDYVLNGCTQCVAQQPDCTDFETGDCFNNLVTCIQAIKPTCSSLSTIVPPSGTDTVPSNTEPTTPPTTPTTPTTPGNPNPTTPTNPPPGSTGGPGGSSNPPTEPGTPGAPGAPGAPGDSTSTAYSTLTLTTTTCSSNVVCTVTQTGVPTQPTPPTPPTINPIGTGTGKPTHTNGTNPTYSATKPPSATYTGGAAKVAGAFGAVFAAAFALVF